MDELQDFVSEESKNSMKQRFTPTLRNNERRSKFEKHKDFLQVCCLCVNCTFVTGV